MSVGSRTGVISRKLGMSRVFMEGGDCVPVTLLSFEDVRVVATKTVDKDGYCSVQISAGQVKSGRVNKPTRGYYAKQGVAPGKILKEFRLSNDANLPEIGSIILPSYFQEGQVVDVSGISIGKGFAGTVKRHNFRGLGASHGVSLGERKAGSTGIAGRGRCHKNKKMAGHMGNVLVTEQGIKVIEFDDENGILLLKGSVPGHIGSWLFVRDSVLLKRSKYSSLAA